MIIITIMIIIIIIIMMIMIIIIIIIIIRVRTGPGNPGKPWKIFEALYFFITPWKISQNFIEKINSRIGAFC